jgi:exodeoxyribonuclease V gamma subunit
MQYDTKRATTIQVWYSNQLERLSQQLIQNLGVLDDSRADCLFAMPTIIVPNRNIATFLKYEIARGAGIAAGQTFQMTEEFLETLLRRSNVESPPKLVSSVILRALFIDILSDESDSVRPLPDVVRTYIGAGGNAQDARDLRRFQLGSRLAVLTRQYGNYRPAWLRAWAKGEAMLGDDPLARTEDWQRELWVRLIEHLGTEPDGATNWVLPFELFGYLERTGVMFPAEIHLFGFSYVWHGLRDMIEQLNKHSKLSIYTLAPFAQRGDDLATLGVKRRAGFRPPERAGRSLNTAERYNAGSMDDFPIVTQWGRPGLEYFEMLGEIPDVNFNPGFVAINQQTALGRLQQEILERAAVSDKPVERDDSLVILACAGIRREAEVIGNEIWSLIRKDAGLRFCEIAVLLADRANQAAYQAHLRAVFEGLHGIPYNMVDLPLAGECRVIEALLLLLALPMSEFTRPEVLKILGHPAVRARFPEADTARWRDWCLELEIVRGADHLDHDGTYIDRELFHWEQGLRRLVLGAFMTGSQSGDDLVYHLGGVEYLPYDQPTEALPDVGRLLALMRSLVADARFAQTARLTMTQWSTFFARMADAYLAADSDTEEQALSQCLQRIEALRNFDTTGQPVGYRIACETLREALEGLTGARGHYLTNGVVISPVLEMRSLPFRVIFLCGLGEGHFPAVDGPDPLDLTLTSRRRGDVSPRERDKYLFLETLVCARERLYLSYTARDAQTGDELAPSTVVHELIRHLNGRRPGNTLHFWVEKQPLRRFQTSYVATGPACELERPTRGNFSFAAWQELQACNLRQSLREHVKEIPRLTQVALRRLQPSVVDWLGLCPIDGARAERPRHVTIALRDLVAFLRCPLQGWARLMLRLREDSEDDEIARENEPFMTSRSGETALLREVFFDALGRDVQVAESADVERLYTLHAESRARRGLLPIGVFGEAERRRHLACLASWHESARQRDLVDRCRFQVYRFGRAGENEHIERIQSPIVLDVPLGDGSSNVRVELHGRTELIADELPGSITPVVRDKPTERDFLAAFVDAIVLSLIPSHHTAAKYHAHVIPEGNGADFSASYRVFHGIDAPRAREYLVNLLSDLLGGSHAYLLPCEAVFEYVSKERPIESSIEDMKENENKSCSSRYGPVPNFEEYDPPNEHEARRIIERRFGLFHASGEISI